MKPYPDDDEQGDVRPEDEPDYGEESFEEPDFYDQLGILICQDDDPLSDAPAFDEDLVDSDFPESNFDECGLNDTDQGGDYDL